MVFNLEEIKRKSRTSWLLPTLLFPQNPSLFKVHLSIPTICVSLHP